MQLADLQYLMAQLGPENSDVLLVVQQSDECWEVELEGELSLQISWQAQRSSVIVSCGLGYPACAERESVYALLLNENLVLAGLSGVRLALSKPDQEVMLIGECFLSSNSAPGLYQHLAEFIHLALRYAALIAQPSQTDAPAPVPLIAQHASLDYQRA